MLTYIDSITMNIGVMSVSMVGEIFFTQTVFDLTGVRLAVTAGGLGKIEAVLGKTKAVSGKTQAVSGKTQAVSANTVTISVKLFRCCPSRIGNTRHRNRISHHETHVR